MVKTQLVAATVVQKVLSGNNLTGVLQELWQSESSLTPQQRGAIQDLSYGVLRFYGQLEAVLGLLLNKPVRDRQLHHLLLIGLYQLLYSKTRPFVVVDHAVNASRSLTSGKGMQGLVNAVLRNFLRRRDALLEQAAQRETGCYSYPQWWVDKLRLQYPQQFRAILESGNQHPSMTLRVNQRKIAVEDYRALLVQHDMQAEWLSGMAIKLDKPVIVQKLPGFHEGLVSIQDLGAQYAAPLLDIHDGMRVLDACAAPGGKTAHLLELANIALTVVDNDVQRLARVRENLGRLNLSVEQLLCGDAGQPGNWWNGQGYDRILADVPCSASGVVRRHPDIKWLRRESDIAKLVAQQREMLDALWKILNRNGKLLYVTCSIFAEENMAQIEKFIHQQSDARLLPLSGLPNEILSDGQLLLDERHDGFFYALLQKV